MCVCVCVCVCTYMHVCTYTHLHIHIYFSQHVDLSNIIASRPGHTKDHHEMVQTASLHGTQCVRVGVCQCSPTV